MTENREEVYFDSEELEDIIIYYLELGDISYAEKAVQYGLKLHPNSLEIKTKLLEVYIEQEKYPEAKTLIAELEPACGESTDFLVCTAKYFSNLGNPKKAIAYCERALTLEEEQNFLHNFIADEYVNLGDPFAALKNYRKALQYDPNDEYALENAVQCFYDVQKLDELEAFLERYLDDFPFSEIAWNELGQLMINRKKYDRAIRAFDFQLAINQSALSVYSMKAGCYEAMEQWDKAIEVYTEALEHEFTKSYTYYKIGLCYRELGQPAAALGAFQRSLIEDPQFYQSMMEQSHVYEELGSWEEALHFAKEAVSHNEADQEFQKRLAYLYVCTGRYEESCQTLRKLVQQHPEKFYYWYAFAEVLMLLGEHEEALKLLTGAVNTHQRAELFYQLANCYLLLEEVERGELALEKAYALDPALAEEMEQKYPSISPSVKKVRSRK